MRSRENERLLRTRSMPTSIDEPKVMSSRLYRLASTDRLPGMAPCYVRKSVVKSEAKSDVKPCRPTARSLSRPPSRSSSQSPKKQQPLERRSSGASNSNVSVQGIADKSRRISPDCLDEPKLLNLHVNGFPVNSNLPIHTRINNMPIRITTSQPTDDNLRFSLNRVRVSTSRDLSGQERRRSSSRGSSTGPYNIRINVYATDNP